MAELDQINIVVRNMDAMAAFHESLGVELRDGPPEWQPHHRNSSPNSSPAGTIAIELDSGRLAVVADPDHQAAPPPPPDA